MKNIRHCRLKTKGIADEKQKALQTKNIRHCRRKTKRNFRQKTKGIADEKQKEFQTKNKRHCRRDVKLTSPFFALSGASDGIRTVLKLVLPASDAEKPVGVMIPLPQYPLYSASVAEFGAYQVRERVWLMRDD